MLTVSNLRPNIGRGRKKVFKSPIWAEFPFTGFLAAPEVRGSSFAFNVCLTVVFAESTQLPHYWKVAPCDVTKAMTAHSHLSQVAFNWQQLSFPFNERQSEASVSAGS